MRTLLAMAVLLTACATTDAGTDARPDPAVVTTDAGAVRGALSGRHRLFQGIRYATVARWDTPKPAPAWRGVKDATKPGAMCPQVGSVYAPIRSETEDCLFLNVTTPAKPGPAEAGTAEAGTAEAGTGRPVMVWVHGDGALGAGHFSDARKLAERGVVVVTINYRLGVFSGFGHPGLRDSGTYGLQDQLEALRWVRRNAAAFGGDPRNVTVFGVSYGALAIGGLLTAPAAKGLFDRAIMQSGETMMDMPAGSMVPGLPAQPSFAWRSEAEVIAMGEHFAGLLGCSDLACLRRLPVKRILEVPQIMNAFQSYAYGNGVLPDSPATAIRKGRFHRVPVLAGATRDEHSLFVAMNYDMQGKTPDYSALVWEAFGKKAPHILRKYPVNRYKSPSLAWSAVLTDRMWARATHEQNTLLARHVPVYGYEFADRKAPMFLPLETDFAWGAYHAADLPYLFEDGKAALSAGQRKLSGQMIGYWTNFARGGDPNGPGLPTWPRLSNSTLPLEPGSGTLSLEPGSGTLSLEPGAVRPVDYAARHQLSFWK